MAATDQTYRHQKTLDIVFALSGILMLLSIVGMFAQDYFRDFKVEQRRFRDVEAGMAERALLTVLPLEKLTALTQAEKDASGDKAALQKARQDFYKARKSYLDAQDKLRQLKVKLDATAEPTPEQNDAVAKAQAAVEDAKKTRDQVTADAPESIQKVLAAEEDVLAFLDERSNAEKAVADARTLVAERTQKAASKVHAAEVAMAVHDANYRGYKANYDSKESLYNIAVDERDNSPRGSPIYSDHDTRAQALAAEMKTLAAQRDSEQAEVEKAKQELTDAQLKQAEAETVQTRAEDRLKKARSDYERYQKLVEQKRWKASDWLLSQPVLDAANSPYRIQQYTLAEYPIDYAFKYVTRYDRCTTCHLGMERANFERTALLELRQPPSEDEIKKKTDPQEARIERIHLAHYKSLQDNLARFRQVLSDCQARGEPTGGFNLYDLPDKVPTLPATDLTEARLTQFAAHPRLDLFVDANSPHPADKFGCTSCHSGQGSATDFFNAAHAPNSDAQRKHWEEEHGWEASHFWDFPMLAKRFEEASCLKCHHQVTDLIRYANQEEAPKLIRGYNLLRDNGCFGCHEIAGMKRGREIGPDVRLEPTVPLSALDPAERAKLEADRANPPGTMRKVGPSLFRLSEKTNRDWVERWVWRPRDFRPDTKMPHFYGLSNNDPHALLDSKDYGPDQQQFPAAEVRAIAEYVMHGSEQYLKGDDFLHHTTEALKTWLEERKKKEGRLPDAEQKELDEVTQRLANWATEAPLLELRKKPIPIADKLVDVEGKEVTLPPAKQGDDLKKQEANGHKLFTEKGCLACHSHEGTAKASGDGVTPVVSTANFGPDLSHIAAKLGTQEGGKESARRWLVQWILNPQQHHPRTRMPYMHLDVDQTNDVAAWLLSQGAEQKGTRPDDIQGDEKQVYLEMARLYLTKARSKQEIEQLLDPKAEITEQNLPDWLQKVRPDSDEGVLRGGITVENLKRYVGRKAISRLGCFGCHNVPGFETAKPVGTPLNDWGKKDPERLAFEDVLAYVDDHHSFTEGRSLDAKQLARLKQLSEKEETERSDKEKDELARLQRPYENFYWELLKHQQREGFLNQKLGEPRSYDYHRKRAWDDRLRMPQFKFSRSKRGADESDIDYEQRLQKEEAEAREAVMTFVLGLVAEPVPAEYLNQPRGDRLAQVRGRQVLDQSNCAGCHQIRPGVYEFKATRENLQPLQETYRTVAGSFGSDYGTGHDHAGFFAAHNAWDGPAPPWPDRVLAFGVNRSTQQGDEGEDVTVIRLAEALRYSNKDEAGKVQTFDIPAGTPIQLPKDLLSQTDTFGGTFPQLMVPYLNKLNPTIFKMDASGDSDEGRSVLPPQLTREGERTQPDWLFQFLRNPTVVRPQERMLLRMPKFNLSDEEFLALVNYFNAVDREGNPGIGLHYPYTSVKEREEDYWRERTAAYKKQLGPEKLEARAKEFDALWKQALEDQLTETRRQLEAAKELVKAAKDDNARRHAERYQRELEAQVTTLEKKDVTPLRKQWEDTGVYAADAYRLLANDNSPCLSCHQVGAVPPKEAKGPPLQLSAARLRPDWTERWLANPGRLMYPTIMPQNFPRDKKENQELFPGLPGEQAQAVRDVLLNFPQVADRPENRYYRSRPQ